MSSLSQHSPAAFGKDARLAQLTAWLGTLDLVDVGSLRPASADASFRRYWRLTGGPFNQIVDCGNYYSLASRRHYANVATVCIDHTMNVRNCSFRQDMDEVCIGILL